MTSIQQTFEEKINDLIAQINEFKQKNDHLWRDEYEFILMDLEEVLEINISNYSEAESKFNKIVLSKYDCFDNYVKQNDQSVMNKIRGTNIRVKLSRAKRKQKMCPMCNAEVFIKDNTYVCKKCDYVTDVKTTKNKSVVRTNDNIYIHKQLSGMMGIKKPPSNMVKIIKYLAAWLTEMKYIDAWLKFKTDILKDMKGEENHYEAWCIKYFKASGIEVDADFASISVPQEEKYRMTCEIFKVFSDEFYKMLEYAKSCSKINISNMYMFDEDKIIDIITRYIKVKGKVKPNLDETFEDYDVGHYINELSLIHTVPDENHIKIKLEKLFGFSLTIPGLMFNFNELYTINENIPQCYNYMQEFPYIIHETFKVPYVTFPSQTKELIVELISKFNTFHKSTESNTSNAPLLCVTLSNILDLPYFNEYKDQVMKFLPVKDKNTVGYIKTKWFMFSNEYEDYLKQFYVVDKKTETEDKTPKNFITMDTEFEF